MPSDDRVPRALQAVAPSRAAFRSTLALSVGHLDALLADARPTPAAARLEHELGVFARGRIDVQALAALAPATDALDGPTLQRLQQARQTLDSLAAHGDELFVLPVAADEDLTEALRVAYGARGRAFAAAHVVHLARAHQPLGRFANGAGSYPFSRWNARERAAAPPLVVEIAGAQVSGAALAEFMDGRVHIVLLADGACAPAPLVRLITPATLVLQTSDPAELDVLADYGGPAVALLGGDEIASFTHDPRAGATLRARLHISRLPQANARMSAIARDELAQLAALHEALRAAPSAAVVEPSQVTAADPVDRLAAWLLRHADDAEG